jgi:hypothetical protein
MQKLIAFLFVSASFASGANQQTFTGVVTDSMCRKNHAMMKMTPESKCVRDCVKGGSKYDLFDGTNTYVLSDQKTPEGFVGQRVRITFTLFEKTKILKADSIVAAR